MHGGRSHAGRRPKGPTRRQGLAWGLVPLALVAGGVLSDGSRADEPLTGAALFNGPIVRILHTKCVPCHVTGGLSIPLATYHDVRPWARAIREEILERRMPPWPAATIRPFVNDLTLSGREIALLVSWIDGGTPRGDERTVPRATLPPAADRRSPDVTLSLPPVAVAAHAPPTVRRLSVRPVVPPGRSITGLDYRPGDRRLVRSVRVYQGVPNGPDARWLGAWTPWYATARLPEGLAHALAPGGVLTVDLHIQGTDVAAVEQGTLVLFLAERPPAATPPDLTLRLACSAPPRAVPSGADACRVARAGAAVSTDLRVWALNVEAVDPAVRALEVRATKPDGAVEVLAWVPRLAGGWPTPFVLRDPVVLPRGSRLAAIAEAGSAVIPDTPLVRVRVSSLPGTPAPPTL